MGITNPGTITLDGFEYAVLPDQHGVTEEKIGSTYRSATGYLRRQDANVFDTRYELSLDCTWEQANQLRTSFKKVTPGSALLDFTDERGVRWTPNAGTDTAYIHYGTGVYFESLRLKSEQGTGYSETQGVFVADITLHVNAKVLA